VTKVTRLLPVHSPLRNPGAISSSVSITGVMRKLTILALLVATAMIAVPSLAATTDDLPFIDDDYAQALAQARAKNVPIFVEAWAPW